MCTACCLYGHYGMWSFKLYGVQFGGWHVMAITGLCRMTFEGSESGIVKATEMSTIGVFSCGYVSQIKCPLLISVYGTI